MHPVEVQVVGLEPLEAAFQRADQVGPVVPPALGSSGSVFIEYLLARMIRLRSSPMKRPSMLSLAPMPYMSAVSMKFPPAAR